MHIVLVHGAGGSPLTWCSVAPLLEARGHRVSVADNPSQSLDDDVAAVRRLVDGTDQPALLVGHSYGGAVITNAGGHERVRGLVYVAAFAPAENESVTEIVGRYEPAPASAYFTRGPDGEWVPGSDGDTWRDLAWDVPEEIRLAAATQRRASANAIFTRATGAPAWSRRSSWYLVASEDRHLRPQAQRDMAARAGATVSEVPTSHAVPHAAPERVVEVVEQAVTALARP